MEINVRKYTDVEMLRRANSFSTSKESKMDLATAYRLGHSSIRTQRFEIELRDIPQFVANQLVRHHVGVDWVMKSKRPDRGGSDFKQQCFELARDLKVSALTGTLIEDDFEEIINLPKHYDRYAPTDLWCDINAEALINMAHKRICGKASKETIEVVATIRDKVAEVDPDLAKHMVSQCIYRGVCPETKSCGYISSEEGQARLRYYRALFTKTNER